jgi:hypothetical protein
VKPKINGFGDWDRASRQLGTKGWKKFCW